MFYQLYKEFSGIFAILDSLFPKNNISKEPNFDVFVKKRCIIDFCPDTKSIYAGGDIVKVDDAAVFESFLHAMIHWKNYSNGVIDNRKGYHNEKFLNSALEVGLFVSYHPSYGWKTTYLNCPKDVKKVRCPTDDNLIKRQNAFRRLSISKQSVNKVQLRINEVNRRSRIGIYFLKYECCCSPPHNSIRSGRRPDGQNPLHIKCLDCGKPFKCVDV